MYGNPLSSTQHIVSHLEKSHQKPSLSRYKLATAVILPAQNLNLKWRKVEKNKEINLENFSIYNFKTMD